MTVLRPKDEATIRDAHRIISGILDEMSVDESGEVQADDERRIDQQRSRILRAVFDSLRLR